MRRDTPASAPDAVRAIDESRLNSELVAKASAFLDAASRLYGAGALRLDEVQFARLVQAISEAVEAARAGPQVQP